MATQGVTPRGVTPRSEDYSRWYTDVVQQAELADPALREKMSAAALRLRDHVSMKRHVEELNAILLEAADRRGTKRRAPA